MASRFGRPASSDLRDRLGTQLRFLGAWTAEWNGCPLLSPIDATLTGPLVAALLLELTERPAQALDPRSNRRRKVHGPPS